MPKLQVKQMQNRTRSQLNLSNWGVVENCFDSGIQLGFEMCDVGTYLVKGVRMRKFAGFN